MRGVDGGDWGVVTEGGGKKRVVVVDCIRDVPARPEAGAGAKLRSYSSQPQNFAAILRQ